MTENIITLDRANTTATNLIRHERSTAKVRYSAYITEHGVTLETVKDHVQALADLAGDIREWESPAERKNFCNKIRNGLNYYLGKAPKKSEDESTNLLTADGVAAIAALLVDGDHTDEIIAAIAAEVERRAK